MLAPFLLPDGYGRPSLAALLREGRVVGEAGRLAVHRRAARRARRRMPYAERAILRAPEPVVLVPGFFAGDWSLRALAGELRSSGFRTYRSHIHANVNCTLAATELIEERLELIVERRGARVQIVGHSLGGMMARGIAARRPDLVAGVITMGSPMRAPAAHHRLLTGGVHVLTALDRLGVRGLMSADCVGGSCAEASFEETQRPLPSEVTMTNIYSRLDGVVDWRACIDPQGEPIEVRASHLGMAVDPRVIEVVIGVLARRAGSASIEVSHGRSA